MSKQKKNTTNKVGPEEDISECTFKPKINEKTNYSENENVYSILILFYRLIQLKELKIKFIDTNKQDN